MKKYTPTTKLLLVSAWGVFFLSAVSALFVGISNGMTLASLLLSVLVMAGGTITAVVLKMFANTSQLIFDLNVALFNNLSELHKNMGIQHQDAVNQIHAFRKDLTATMDHTNEFLAEKLAGLRNANEAFTNSIAERLADLKDANAEANDHLRGMGHDARQINEFVSKMKQHIEAQQ